MKGTGFFKAIGALLGLMITLVIIMILLVQFTFPRVRKADQTIKVELTEARIKRGDYLANHVAGCMGCHSQRQWDILGHPAKPGTEGAGGDKLFDKRIGLPGSIYPKNITPYNLKRYSDGELVRVLRTGVDKEGEPLFPMMPYKALAEMEQEDLYSIIAYLRSLPEIANDVPKHKIDFPVNLIIRSVPKNAPEYPKPLDRKDTVAYGKYLVRMGSCTDCHTPVDDHHEPLANMYLAGGQEYPYLNNKLERHPGGGVLRVPNITPDPETGIGKWTKAQFIARFAEWRGKKLEAKHVKLDLDKGDYLPLMPYGEYAGMTDEDLGAIYDYLHQVPAIKHEVVRFEKPKI